MLSSLMVGARAVLITSLFLLRMQIRTRTDIQLSFWLFRHCVSRRYLKRAIIWDANIVANPVFEKAIMKLQDDSPNELNEEEKQAVAYLFTVNFEAEDQQQYAETDTDFARSIIKKRKMTMPVKKYESCKFILPTSDLVERFFSSAGYALSDLRNRLLPSNLELQLFLKVNKRFWDKKNCSKRNEY